MSHDKPEPKAFPPEAAPSPSKGTPRRPASAERESGDGWFRHVPDDEFSRIVQDLVRRRER